MSAFLSYSQQMRQGVREQYPSFKNTDISTVLAQMWREVSDETKRPFLDQEQIDRIKYHEQTSKWKEEEAERSVSQHSQSQFSAQSQNSNSRGIGNSLNSPADSVTNSNYVHQPSSRYGNASQINNDPYDEGNGNYYKYNQVESSSSSSASSLHQKRKISFVSNHGAGEVGRHHAATASSQQIPPPSRWLVDYQDAHDGSNSDPSSNTNNHPSDSSFSKWGSNGGTSNDKSKMSSSDQALLRSLAMRNISNGKNHEGSHNTNSQHNQNDKSKLNPLMSTWNRVKVKETKNKHAHSHTVNHQNHSSSTHPSTSSSGSSKGLSRGVTTSESSSSSSRVNTSVTGGHTSVSSFSNNPNPLNYNHKHASDPTYATYRGHSGKPQQLKAKTALNTRTNSTSSNTQLKSQQIRVSKDNSRDKNNQSSKVSGTSSGHTSSNGTKKSSASSGVNSHKTSSLSNSFYNPSQSVRMMQDPLLVSSPNISNPSNAANGKNSGTLKNNVYNQRPFANVNQNSRTSHQKDVALYYENAMWGSGESYHPHPPSSHTQEHNHSITPSVNTTQVTSTKQHQLQQLDDQVVSSSFTTLFNASKEDKKLLNSKPHAIFRELSAESTTSNSDMISTSSKLFDQAVAADLFNALQSASSHPSTGICSGDNSGSGSSENSDNSDNDNNNNRKNGSGCGSKAGSDQSRKPSPLDVWPFNIGFDSRSNSASRSVSNSGGGSHPGSESDPDFENGGTESDGSYDNEGGGGKRATSGINNPHVASNSSSTLNVGVTKHPSGGFLHQQKAVTQAAVHRRPPKSKPSATTFESMTNQRPMPTLPMPDSQQQRNQQEQHSNSYYLPIQISAATAMTMPSTSQQQQQQLPQGQRQQHNQPHNSFANQCLPTLQTAHPLSSSPLFQFPAMPAPAANINCGNNPSAVLTTEFNPLLYSGF